MSLTHCSVKSNPSNQQERFWIISLFRQTATAAQQFFLYGLVSLLCLLLALLYWRYFSPPIFLLDDSYIVLHNAQVLLQKIDINYPQVAPVYGSSSLIHLTLVAFFGLFFPVDQASMMVCWLAFFLYSLGLLRLAFVWHASVLQALGIWFIGISVGKVIFHLLAGLEVGVTLSALTWTLVCFSQPQTQNMRIIGHLLAGSLPFIRPELAFLSVLLCLQQTYVVWQDTKNWHLVWRDLLINTGLQLIAAMPWMLWYWLQTGLPVPATINAKFAFFIQDYVSIWKRLKNTGLNMLRFGYPIGYLSLLGMFVLNFTTRLGRCGILFILLVLSVYTVTLPYVLNFNLQRYCYIFLPVLLLGLVTNLQQPDKTLRYLANGLLCLSLFQSLWHLPDRWQEYLSFRKFSQTEPYALASWCQHNLPANAVIAVQDAGFLAYKTHFRLVDIVGLKTPESMVYHKQITLPSKGRRRIEAISKVMLDLRAQYLIINPEWDNFFHISDGLRKQGWHLNLLRSGNRADYKVYKIDLLNSSAR